MKKLPLVGMLVFASSAVFADNNYSIELNKTSFEDSVLEAQSNSLSFVYNFNISEQLSVLAKFGKGVHDDDIDAQGEDSKLTIDYLAGAYVKYNFMEDSDFNVYGVVGYNKIKLTAEANNNAQGQSETGFAYGLGASYQIGDMALYLDGNQLIDSDGVTMDSINLGVTFNF